MKISSINNQIKNLNKNSCAWNNISNAQTINMQTQAYSSENIRANFAPLSFKGAAPNIERAFIITKEEEDIPLLETKANGSYIVDFDSQTEVIYGRNAINYLRKNNEFAYDTQVIIPKNCEGALQIDGKTIQLGENSAVLIKEGTEAKVKIKKGYPMIILSKKDYDWYERYGKNAQTQTIKDKFAELEYYNAHMYNGHFSPNMLLPDEFNSETYLRTLGIEKYQSRNYLIYDLALKRDSMSPEKKEQFDKAKALFDKLVETGIIEQKPDGYVKFKLLYNDEYQQKILKEKGFTDEEIKTIMPIFAQTRMVHGDSRFCRKSLADSFPQETVARLKECGILHNNKKGTETLYWKESYANEQNLRQRLHEAGFSAEEENLVVRHWQETNNTGYDISGLKFINENAAVYNLNDKLNNWTLEKTNWVSNSTALTASDGTTPFIGTSLVQTDENRVFAMDELRKGEKLHKHPNKAEKRQTEMYMVTSGAAALVVVKDGKPEVKILKEGDLAVIDAGVEHCVNSVLGKYEHIVVQVPSAFQYGFDFKCITPEPEGYSKEKMTKEAALALKETKF